MVGGGGGGGGGLGSYGTQQELVAGLCTYSNKT